jgi:hypothetical protein
MTRLLTALNFLACVAITEAKAQAPYHFNGKELFELCTSGQDNAAYLSCALFIRGFLAGVLTATGTGEYRDANSNMSLCLPHGLGAGEAAAAFVQTWRSLERTHGDVGPLINGDADAVLAALLMKAYPCK